VKAASLEISKQLEESVERSVTGQASASSINLQKKQEKIFQEKQRVAHTRYLHTSVLERSSALSNFFKRARCYEIIFLCPLVKRRKVRALMLQVLLVCSGNAPWNSILAPDRDPAPDIEGFFFYAEGMRMGKPGFPWSFRKEFWTKRGAGRNSQCKRGNTRNNSFQIFIARPTSKAIYYDVGFESILQVYHNYWKETNCLSISA